MYDCDDGANVRLQLIGCWHLLLELESQHARQEHERKVQEQQMHERKVHERKVQEQQMHERKVQEQQMHERKVREQQMHERKVQEQQMHVVRGHARRGQGHSHDLTGSLLVLLWNLTRATLTCVASLTSIVSFLPMGLCTGEEIMLTCDPSWL